MFTGSPQNQSPTISSGLTSQDVFSKRKAGQLDEAYQIATQLINISPDDEWNLRALGWCLIDLVKRESQKNNMDAVSAYLQQVNSLSFAPTDNVILEQLTFVNKLANPANRELQKAKQASKEGKHQLAINIYRQVLNEQRENEDIKTSLGWELYKVAKQQLDTDKVNVNAIKRILHDYLKLSCQRPSLLHSLILGIADKLINESNFNLVGFMKMWGIHNLREEDYEPYKDAATGKVYPSLAAKIVQHGTKQAIEKDELALLQLFIPLIDKVLATSEEKIWLEYYKARALNALGDYQNSFDLAIRVAKQKVGDYWVWDLLGDIQVNLDVNKAFNCFCRALSSRPDEKYIANLRLKLASLMVDKGDFSAAKCEIKTVIEARNKEGWVIPEKVNEFQNQPWFDEVIATNSNVEMYNQFAKQAEEVLFHNLPWLNANLGATFSLASNPAKKRRKIYIKNSPDHLPTEVSLPEQKFPFSKAIEGASVKFKGEVDSASNRFTAYQFEERSGEKWDVFTSSIGVIDHVNEEKKLIHVIFERNVDLVVPFARLPKKYQIGDVISAKLAKSRSKKGDKFQAMDIEATSEEPKDSVLRLFREEVRISNDLGFTDTDIFIDRNLVKEFKIEDGFTVEGKAVLNFNKKHSTWGWKAIIIHSVSEL